MLDLKRIREEPEFVRERLAVPEQAGAAGADRRIAGSR
jgi:hypothetical protein